MTTHATTSPVGRIVALSLGTGLLTATGLAFAPFVAVDADTFTGMVLLGFALGWGLLAGLSVRFGDQPQRWAAAPATFMATAGVIVGWGPDWLSGAVLGWVWPPALLGLVVWMYRRARRDLHSRTRVLLLHPILALLAIAALAGGYETVAASTQAPAPTIRGRLVDVGGHRLHLECTGTRSPTVVLQPGGGAMSADLGLITPAVARDTRVCVYDRPGRGASDPVGTAQDGAQIAAELHTLLHRAHVPGPYVLAGHSFGGLYVMSYAAQFPEDVAGLVLVDSTAPAAPTAASSRPRGSGSYDLTGRVASMVASTARLGLGRVIGRLSYSTLPERSRDEARASSATPDYLASFITEFAVASRSSAEAGRLTDLGATPLIVVTADRGNAPGWGSAQDAMAALSSNSLHRVVVGATHDSLLADPDDARAVTQAIRDVVDCVRTATPLTD